jgi:tRNA A37 threonylcarbamoyladenosine dehydratase
LDVLKMNNTLTTLLSGITIGVIAATIIIKKTKLVNNNNTTTTTITNLQSNNTITKQQQNDITTTNNSEQFLLQEQLSRVVQMMGEDGMQRIMSSTITVIGLGGVGSHAAHLLVRSGVRHIRLVDFDLVTLSSLNRHAVAIREDVGLPKATVTANRFKQFAGPTLITDVRVEMFQENNADSLLVGSDFVLDCIDDLLTKIQLLAACSRLRIKVISSLSAGGKVDPTRIRIAKLQDVTYDAMATSMRYKSKGCIIDPEIEYVYSTENTQVKLLDLDEAQAENPSAYGALPNFRLRVQPVLGTSPSSFGIAMAARVLTQVSQVRTFIPMSVDSVSAQVIQQMIQRACNRELAVFHQTPNQFTEGDGAVLVGFFQRRCMLSGSKLGAHGVKLEFARFKTGELLTLTNTVLVRKDIADAFYDGHRVRLKKYQELINKKNNNGTNNIESLMTSRLDEDEINHQDVTNDGLILLEKMLTEDLGKFTMV